MCMCSRLTASFSTASIHSVWKLCTLNDTYYLMTHIIEAVRLMYNTSCCSSVWSNLCKQDDYEGMFSFQMWEEKPYRQIFLAKTSIIGQGLKPKSTHRFRSEWDSNPKSTEVKFKARKVSLCQPASGSGPDPLNSKYSTPPPPLSNPCYLTRKSDETVIPKHTF